MNRKTQSAERILDVEAIEELPLGWLSAGGLTRGLPVMSDLASRIKERLRREEDRCVYYAALTSPIGEILVACRERSLCAVAIGVGDSTEFARSLASRFGVPVLFQPGKLAEPLREIREYFENRRRRFDLPVDVSWMTPFQRDVLEFTAEIPVGEVRTYGEVARSLGKAGAYRAVGSALGKNPVPIVIPCHRVVAVGGRIGGYSGGGPAVKRLLLRMEGVALPPNA